MSQSIRYGVKGKAYYRSAGSWASPTWTEIKNVNGDLNIDQTYEEFDATIRLGSDETMVLPTMRTSAVSFKMIENLADTVYAAIRAAFIAKTILDMAFASGDVAVSGESVYASGWMCVTGMKLVQGQKSANTYEVTIKYSLPDDFAQLPYVGLAPIVRS